MAESENGNSCLVQQINERAVLQSIYGDQFLSLSKKGKPLECVLHLFREKPQTDKPCETPELDLHITCSKEYPTVVPTVRLENWKNIANDHIASLNSTLENCTVTSKGQVVIHELAQYCEEFLYSYETTAPGSLYEGMIQRNKDLEEVRVKELQTLTAAKALEKKKVMNRIQSQQQAVRKALRRKSRSDTIGDDCELPTMTENVTRDAPANSSKSTGVEAETPWDLLTRKQGSSRFQSDFEFIRNLGEGAFGEVAKVRNRLDDGHYAIKKIKLNPSMKQLNRKITREVKLLSCLNHENVVRYYNSWVELANLTQPETAGAPQKSVSQKRIGQEALSMLPGGQDIEIDWNDSKTTSDSSGSEWLMFGDNSADEEEEEEEESSELSSSSSSSDQPPQPMLYMYIQMELCEKSTLRIAIDKGLYLDTDLVWRLFREIVEGLCHIHHQGIMHRDLKPMNIFLDHNNQVKIGDFGLATTNKTQKSVTSGRDVPDFPEVPELTNASDELSHTGPVGTALYVAPELEMNEERSIYNQKVDIYSLGIIFFEMNHPPFKTLMEKWKVLSNLRTAAIVFPEGFHLEHDAQQVRLIRWMLQHDIKDRPSSQELLADDSLVTVKLDEGEVKEMVRRTLCNPQSKDYKYLVAACFDQCIPATFEATYNMSTFRSFWWISSLNIIEERLRAIFHRYGAVSFSPPLFTPGKAPQNGVSLMTSVGGVVHANHDLQMPFARYVVQNPLVSSFKRYALGKAYKEMPVGIHPREVHECAFDIVSPTCGDMLPDLELLAVVRDILKAFPQVLRRNCNIYLSHSLLMSSLLGVCALNSPTHQKHVDMRRTIAKAMSDHSSKEGLLSALKALRLCSSSINTILHWIELEGGPKEVMSEISKIFKEPEYLTQCLTAIKQLQCLIKDCGILGMPCPVVIKPSLVYDPDHYTGVVFQVKCDSRGKGKGPESSVMISGGRYDGLLEQLMKKILSTDTSKPRCVTGFTVNLENLISTIDDDGRPTVVDIVFCSLGCVTVTPEWLTLLRELWALNLKVHFSNTMQNMDDIQALCNQLGASFLLLVKGNDPGFVRVRSLNKDCKTGEKKLSYCEVVDYLTKPFKQDSTPSPRSVVNIPEVSFISTEKITMGNMKIYESQINENLSALLTKFSSDAQIKVLALPVKGDVVKLMSSLVELDDCGGGMNFDPAYKRYPNMKKLIQRASKQIQDYSAHPNTVIILYSLNDNMYKVVM